MNSRFRNAGITLVFLALATPALAGQWIYTFQSAQLFELADPFHAGAESEARDINIHGQIVGWANTSAGLPNAWLREPGGVYIHVGIPLATTLTFAEGINNVGEVVGNWWKGNVSRGFHWHPSTGFMELGTELQPGESYNDQYTFGTNAINDFGMIAGTAAASQPSDIPFLPCFNDLPIYWSRPDQKPKVTHCPGEAWGENETKDVNNYGWMAGFETTTVNRGFRWHQGKVSYVPWPAGGKKDGVSAWGINESAAVAGFGLTAGGAVRALYWDGTSEASQLLGVLPGGKLSRAFDLNDEHFVTGYSERQLSTESGVIMGERAFLWSAQIGLVELPASVGSPAQLYKYCRANAIANYKSTSASQGVIRVVGYCGAEKKRAVRWVVTMSRYWQP